MSVSRLPILISALAAILVIPAQPAMALTLLEAVERSIARSPEIASLKSQVELARARTEMASRPTQPQVGLDTGLGGQYSNLFGRGPATQFRRDLGARASQRLWDAQRTNHSVVSAEKRAQAAGLDVELARERLALLSAEAYLNAVRRKQILKLTQENITYHRWLVDVARERVMRNQLAKARLTELQARLAPLMVEKIEQEAELARALITLKELAGSSTDLQPPPEMAPESRPRPEPEKLLPEVMFNHPAIRRATLLLEAADQAFLAAKAAYWPVLDATASSRVLQDAEGLRGVQWDNQAMLRLNWSLLGEDVPAQVREADAARQSAAAQKDLVSREIAIDVRRFSTTLAALQDQQRVLKDYQAVAKFSMNAGIDYVKRTARFATDMVALAELINVRYHAESNFLANRVDVQLTELRLLQASGKLLPSLDRAYRK
ncbi:MAG: TolC family protein [Candidatus Sericytochromatia bacterium]|nr:TolC family protein [Candidatus Sericytochromatia bacterium]